MGTIQLILMMTVLLAHVHVSSLLTQDTINRIAHNLHVYAVVLENKRVGNTVTHTVQIGLSNHDNEPKPCCDWRLYFHSFFLLFPSDFPHVLSKTLPDQNVVIRMIQGDLYSVEPILGFGPLIAGQWKTITFAAKHSSVAVSDFMPNWYITEKTEIPRTAAAVVTDTKNLNYVLPFKDPIQHKRYPEDRFVPVTPQSRRARLGITNKKRAQKLVIPTPFRLVTDDSLSESSITIDITWRIQSPEPANKDIAQFLSENLRIGVDSKSQPTSVILLETGSIGNKSEAYRIVTDMENTRLVRITGQDKAGLFYGVQSMISLLDGSPRMTLPNLEIHDHPRFPYRGFLLDVARNFHGVDDVKRIIRAMSMYKLNKLVLHLTDDEGWRIALHDLPELTEVGARRCHDLQETVCIIPQLGSGPFNDTRGSGYYTEHDYEDILRYAKKHFVEVIPEIDAPGHAHAAIRAMEMRFVRSGDNTFRLIDPLDSSVYKSTQHWFKNAMNPCIDSTFIFIETVLERIIDIHSRIQPLRTFGIRGDEVPKGAWEKSPECKKFLQRFPRYDKPKGLNQYFAEKVAAMTRRHGLSLLASEDLFFDDKNQPFNLKSFNNDIKVIARRNIWEQKKAHLAYRLANHDYKVIMSQATFLYLDHPYEPDSLEPGLYWATRFTDSRKIFGFKPDALFANIDMTRSGDLLTYGDVCGVGIDICDKLIDSKRHNIIGMQAHLWSENIRDSNRLDYMAFPRLLAVAERSWHKAKFEDASLPLDRRFQLERQDWEDFANTLGYKELRRLEQIGVKYRIPLPGATLMPKGYHSCVSMPGLTPQYSYDDINANNKTWTDVTGPYQKSNRTILLRTKSASGDRYSRIVYLN